MRENRTYGLTRGQGRASALPALLYRETLKIPSRENDPRFLPDSVKGFHQVKGKVQRHQVTLCFSGIETFHNVSCLELVTVAGVFKGKLFFAVVAVP